VIGLEGADGGETIERGETTKRARDASSPCDRRLECWEAAEEALGRHMDADVERLVRAGIACR
jgi:hypothetical protein